MEGTRSDRMLQVPTKFVEEISHRCHRISHEMSRKQQPTREQRVTNSFGQENSKLVGWNDHRITKDKCDMEKRRDDDHCEGFPA